MKTICKRTYNKGFQKTYFAASIGTFHWTRLRIAFEYGNI